MLFRSDDYSIVYALLLGVWIIGTIFAATKGIRFTLLMVPPFVIGIAIFLGKTFAFLKKAIAGALDIPAWIVSVILFLLLLSIFIQPIGAAQQISKGEIPSMNDAWYETLTEIRNASEPEAIISSWWDFGHQFITIANRGATADGANQNTPQAHWLGKLLVTDDEPTSIGILRMLNCDANRAYEKLESSTGDTVVSIRILNSILGVDSDTARERLSGHGISTDQIDDLLASTHCDPPGSFVIASEDMVSKAGVWGHFGSWNFTKARTWNIARRSSLKVAGPQIAEFLDISESEAMNLVVRLKSMSEQEGNAWISPWPQYYTPKGSCNAQQDIIQCSNGIMVNGTQAFLMTQNGAVPAGTFILYANGTKEVYNSEGQDSLAIVMWEDSALAADPLLADSMFTRLFYMDGVGTEYFKRFSDKRSVMGQRIITWSVDWEKYLAEHR